MKLIYKFDLALIFVSMFVLIFTVGYISPLVIYPVDNLKTSESEILFSIEKAGLLLIDDNIDFTTPDEYPLAEGVKINLVPGKYYWKAVGVFQSEVRTLTIDSVVNLQLKKIDAENYGVFNIGNTRLNVEIYNGTELVKTRKLGIEEEMKLTGTKLIGEQDE